MIVSLIAVIAVLPILPEQRALAYLSREVPRWSTDNKCFSCHNNGDAARALYTAQRLRFPLPARTLDSTSAWLIQPKNWHKNGGDVEFKDDALARIQFAAALIAAMEAGLIKDRQPLLTAAAMIATDQRREGCWQADFPGDIGSPVTYGVTLATFQARQILRYADPQKFHREIARADDWLRQAPVQRVGDAAVVLMSLEGDNTPAATERRRQCLETMRKGQSRDGGWGPFVTAAPEVFDTALVVRALSRSAGNEDGIRMRRRGQAFLLSQQRPDGSWAETTRPSGGDSYAQRLSTTGWALLALLDSTGR